MRYGLTHFDPSEGGRRNLLECYDSGMLSHRGPWVERFEQAFADYLGVKHVVACSSGTAALHLALDAVGVSAGDEVIVPDLTYLATANAVRYLNARPLPSETDGSTWNMRMGPVSVVKAIVCTHLLGNPCDMDKLRDVGAALEVPLIEDACEALGGMWRGKRLGTIGEVGCFSFYGNKMLSMGEGGALVTDNDAIAGRARFLRGQACTDTYLPFCLGYNYRLTSLQAAVGLSQLVDLDIRVGLRQDVRRWYFKHLPSACTPQLDQQGGEHAAWMMGVRTPIPASSVRRSLREEGIDTRPMFPPVSRGREDAKPGSMCVADELRLSALVLPCHEGLQETDVEVICEALARAVQ